MRSIFCKHAKFFVTITVFEELNNDEMPTKNVDDLELISVFIISPPAVFISFFWLNRKY